MAPELFEGDVNAYSISPASDVWSFGMLTLEVLTGHQPYRQCKIDGQVIAKLLGRLLPDRPELSDEMFSRGFSENMWILMQHCWSWDPSRRPEMSVLATDVRKFYVEHMRQYGVTGEGNNSSSVFHPTTLFQHPIWATPPSSSNHSLSPSSLALQTSPGIHDSPTPYVPELPSGPNSPTADMTPRNNTLNMGAGAIPIPKRRPDNLNVSQQFTQMTMSEGDSAYGSLPRSATQQMMAQAYRHRSGSYVSHASSIASPHPEGHDKINYDDDGRVLSGNLEGLADRLLTVTHSIRMDEEFRECFLTVYRGFAKADDLLPLLIERYRARAFGFMQERERLKLRKNMITILSKWLETQEIEPKDERFLAEMAAFVNSASTDDPLDNDWRRLQDAIRDQSIKIKELPSLPPTNSGQRIKLSDLDATTIAKQLMRMESDLFQKIRASDYAAWVKNVADEQLQNLPRFSKNNYKIADWCQSMVLFMNSSDIEGRASMIGFLGRVAAECLRIRSFSTANAIMAGLSTDFINGLGYTWRLVDKRTKESLKQISLIVSDEANYKNLLDSDSQVPAVPILSVHLRDLRRLYKEMNTHTEVDGDMLVNFQKFEEVWKSIKAITKYKMPPPTIPKEPFTTTYLEFELSKIEDGVDLQNRFKARSEELKRKEQRDYNNRRLGMEDAGFRPPKTKKK
ncbi:hypothetical protein FRC09_012307 [Ceratobasidium sp. 395]|nr:hypothetical protein FRC09_012307 [Ceratobasidium sp. 395]